MIDKFNFIIPEGFVLVLRTVKPDMSAYGGFMYPTSGRVWAEDWDEKPQCGGGLHGWIWGEGDDSLAIGDEETRLWLVLLVDEAKIVRLDGKVKFPEGEVIFCGDCETAIKTIQWFAPAGAKVNRSTNSGGNRSTNSGGDGSTNSGGNRSTNSGGDGSTNSGGNGGAVVIGEIFAKCKSGIGGLIVFRYYCEKAEDYRLKFAEVDGVKIRENIFYTLSSSLEIVEAGDN